MIIIDYDTFKENKLGSVSALMDHPKVLEFIDKFRMITKRDLNVESILTTFFKELGNKKESALFLLDIFIYYKQYTTENGKQKIMLKMGIEII